MNRRGQDAPHLARVAIVGAATLKGKELKEVLEEGDFPPCELRLLDDDESLGQLDAVGDEATFIQSVRPEQFEDVDVAFFASLPEFTAQHWKLAAQAGCRIVDLSYALENEPGAVVRSPWLEQELGREAGVSDGPVIVAHPASAVLALLNVRIMRLAPVSRAVVTMFEPASEHGRRGMDELHQQTVNLLSFQQLPQQIFDSQVAFNMLARYGEQSSPTLESVERRILAHYQALTAGAAPVPSLMLLQPPVFHGHAFSIYLEFGGANGVAIGDVAQALAGPHVTVCRVAADSPSNVSAAGLASIQVSVRADAHNQRGIWLWAASDNLKLLALQAAECVRGVLAGPASQPAKGVQ
jgi:aspartate-semialdehyde dehydrogenase